MNKQRVVVSTVGASLLFNQVSRDNADERSLLNTHANDRELPPEVVPVVEQLKQKAEAVFDGGDSSKIRRASAELNGIYALYDNRLSQGVSDMQYLIATDTALGRICAGLVEEHLRRNGFRQVEVFVPDSLTVASVLNFETGIKDIVAWCTTTLQGYRDQGDEVIFNLVGAFKSLQGYLNTMGMLYADRILYLFEDKAATPIYIPRLPITVDYESLKPLVPFVLMAEARAEVPLASVGGLSRVLYDDFGTDHAAISDWGLAVWGNVREKILGGELLDFPRLRYTDQFRNDYRNTRSVTLRVQLQATLAEMSALLEKSNGNPTKYTGVGGLNYTQYKGNYVYDGKPVGHFRVSDGERVNSIAIDGGLTLLDYGTHDYAERDRLKRYART